ncbi:hypothetical protein [Phyllobacterium zundukense]|uniref:RNA helicase n=1 Tax=Phyllobacterium zundukense TaxID=1867719 RepID=A0A2N9W4W9_9HYPH|nr:hypothetical protein [Phyllobacterium zundukense]ATU91748.1 hypothetical protein BLM14_09045 [Phyllobacterium zundukense]PIO46787.1 hypothetical protein B5P45_03030 [Phyllobacterium zundukense]
MTKTAVEPVTNDPAEQLICGIVMPISAIGDCNEQHWAEVHSILKDAIKDANFEPNLVSNADEVGVIHKRIIENLYNNPIVVCDISAKNPNVMFELGLRLAFDKPTIVIKDDQTSYNFDTSPIEHLNYPRNLRFHDIVEFKQQLTRKITATYEASRKSDGFTTFLKHFGTFNVAKIETTEVSAEKYILQQLDDIQLQLKALSNQASKRSSIQPRPIAFINLEAELRTYAIERGIELSDLPAHKLELLNYIFHNSVTARAFPSEVNLGVAIDEILQKISKE